jgi:ribosomal protein L40E
MTKKQYIEEHLNEAIECIRKEGRVWPACNLLGIKQQTLTKYLKKAGVDYTKMLKPRGFTLLHVHKRLPAEHYLKKDKYTMPSKLRRILISEGIKENKCEVCGKSTWMGKPIPLELHHINRNRYDNRLENLKILCSNCHMQEHNYSNFKDSKLKAPVALKKQRLCVECGKTISKRAKRCRRCASKLRLELNARLTPENIIKTVADKGSFLQAAKEFGCSGNNLVKFLKKRGYPYHTKDVKAYATKTNILK